MATKTEEYLQILAEGGDAPTGCCTTNTQKLIAEAIDRINNLQPGGGGGGLVLSYSGDGTARSWFFENSDIEPTYDNIISELEKGTTIYVHNQAYDTYQPIDYWTTRTDSRDIEYLRLGVKEYYGALGLRRGLNSLSEEESYADKILGTTAFIEVRKDTGDISVERGYGDATSTIFIEFGDDEYYMYPNLATSNPDWFPVDFYDDPVSSAKVLRAIVDYHPRIELRNYDDDGRGIESTPITYGVKTIQKNGVNVERIYIIYAGITSISSDGSSVQRYVGTFTVDLDDGSILITKKLIQDIPNGENMEF